MKRDMDLVRKILIKMEKDWGYEYLESSISEREIKIEGYSDSAVHYHLRIMIEAGLITCIFPEGDSDVLSTYIKYPPEMITWEGQEFLEAIREEETWKKIKKELKKEFKNLSFAAIKMTALEFLTA